MKKVAAYFEAKDKPFYTAYIENLENRWKECIILAGDYVEELCRIFKEKICFTERSCRLINRYVIPKAVSTPL